MQRKNSCIEIKPPKFPPSTQQNDDEQIDAVNYGN